MSKKLNYKIFLPLVALLFTYLISIHVADRHFGYSATYWLPFLMIFFIVDLILILLTFRYFKVKQILMEKSPLITAVVLLLLVWEVVTAKISLLPLPYFPAPGQVIDVIITDWRMLLISALYSLRLLLTGYLIGGSIGLITGTAIGWNKKLSYWLTPLQKIIGPIPATAWIPIAMTIFPTSFTASIFILSLAVWFPVTVMTGSGISNVRKSYYEVAQTLGADRIFLIFKVALPAALPNIFIGLFMGLGTSFVTLIVAEMLGVKAGLGWYINWAQGWAEYKKVYASLVVMAFMFSAIITLLFKVRNKILIWQRGLIKW